MNTTHEEKKATRDLVNKCRVYLCENFHKFSQYNKIKISLAILAKAMPTEIIGELKVTQMPAIKINDQEKEFFVDYPRFTQDVSDTTEVAASN